MTTLSRCPANAFARTVSPRPLPYVSPVSKKVTPRSSARRSRSAAWSSLNSPHQPAVTVQTPNPTSLRVTSVSASFRYRMSYLLDLTPGPSPARRGAGGEVFFSGGPCRHPVERCADLGDAGGVGRVVDGGHKIVGRDVFVQRQPGLAAGKVGPGGHLNRLLQAVRADRHHQQRVARLPAQPLLGVLGREAVERRQRLDLGGICDLEQVGQLGECVEA